MSNNNPKDRADAAKTADQSKNTGQNKAEKKAGKLGNSGGGAEKMNTKAATKPVAKPAARPEPTRAASASTEPAAAEPRSGKGAIIVAVIALLLALIALGAAAWLYLQSQKSELQAQGLLNTGSSKVESLESELGRTRDALQSSGSRLGEVQQAIAQIDGRVAGLDSQMSNTAGVIDLVNQANANVAQFETRLKQNESGITEIREMTQGGRDAWRRAEIQYLLTVANQRVQVYRDPATAVAAFQAADARLQSLGDPKLVDVRQAVRNAVTDLNAVKTPDIEGLALTLGSYAERVADLPLPRHNPGKAHFEAKGTAGEANTSTGDETAGDKELPVWKRAARTMGDELKSMVVVRRDGKPVKPMLPPDAEFFLRGNLRLQLDAARGALLNRDTANFQSSLKTARGWLTTYFDNDDAAVTSLATELAKLETVNIQPELPDVSPALRLIRGLAN